MSHPTAPAPSPSLLPAVRSAQGALIASIFSHPSFDAEGDRKYGKLFFVFEETVATNEALEVAHLGEDTENATRAALEQAVLNARRIGEDGKEGKGNGEILRLARERYGKEKEIEDVELGDEVRGCAGVVREAAGRALGE